MDRCNDAIGFGRQESEQPMLTLDGGRRLGAAPAVPSRPDAGEGGERAVPIQSKSDGRLLRIMSPIHWIYALFLHCGAPAYLDGLWRS